MAKQDAQAQHRAAAEKIVNRIASDPGYRRELLDDPVGALITLVGLEYQPAQEVTGYAKTPPKPKPRPDCSDPATTCVITCRFSCAPGGTCGNSCGLSRIAAG
jgi:hypothetical protein